jgi:hypothetical protein
MQKIKSFDASEFPLNKDLKGKEGKKIYVVFSTFGEREAELIYEKITLLKNELGDYVDKIFLSHRRENQWEELTEKRAVEADPATEIIICNDLKVPDMGSERGKGADMRRTLYHINCSYKGDSPEKDIIVVFLDTDVVTEHFGSHFVLGLSGAVLSGFDFAKASFWRAMGRVKKFVAQPLFSVVQHPVVSELRNMAYPLSGEVAGTLEFFNKVHFWQMYGVETGINVDSLMMDFRVADVNLGLYDHEHHGDLNIQKMSFGIMRTFLIQLESYGVIEFKDGAEISSSFKASRIDEQGKREKLDFDLSEKKYEPLKKIL